MLDQHYFFSTTQVNNSCYADKIEGFNLTHEFPEQKRRCLL